MINRRLIAYVLLVLLCVPCVVARAQALPEGTWSLVDGTEWVYVVGAETALTPEQLEAADASGIVVVDGMLPAGTAVTQAQLLTLYPDAQGMDAPDREPALALFSLTGEWFYGEDDQLCYDHGDGYQRMTMEEVFEALDTGESTGANAGKTFYLTIDDSPTEYTMDLLATLDRLDVKATFFVVGAYVKKHPVFLRAIYEQGHGIANHSYSHDATNLSSSFKNCLNDFRRCEEAVAEALGFPLEMGILRIPYGAGTLPVAFRTQLQQSGYIWIDWNALNGDTEKGITSDDEALERAFSTAGRYDGDIVMLVHDGKKRTIRTLETMVAHFRELGYTFRVLDTSIEKIPGVRMGLPL